MIKQSIVLTDVRSPNFTEMNADLFKRNLATYSEIHDGPVRQLKFCQLWGIKPQIYRKITNELAVVTADMILNFSIHTGWDLGYIMDGSKRMENDGVTIKHLKKKKSVNKSINRDTGQNSVNVGGDFKGDITINTAPPVVKGVPDKYVPTVEALIKKEQGKLTALFKKEFDKQTEFFKEEAAQGKKIIKSQAKTILFHQEDIVSLREENLKLKKQLEAAGKA